MADHGLSVRIGMIAAVVSITTFVSCALDPSSACMANTSNGDVRGLDLGSSCGFLGIPYAAAPVGSRRWQPPAPAAPWRPRTLDATTESPSCPVVDPPGSNVIVGSEDCLRLNVWTPLPSTRAAAPVLIWIPGDDFVAASASAVARTGQWLVETSGLVVVAPNYRVGALGFLGHAALSAEDAAHSTSANYGLLDQRAAMAWVRDQISAFGGDPNRVTAAGRLAGADSVGLHLVSRPSANHFGRVIMQGGFASSRWRTLAEAESVGDRFAAALGCRSPDRVLECLRSTPVQQVMLALPSGAPQFTETLRAPWGPVVDGVEVPDQPRALYERGAFNRLPVMIGLAGDEGWSIVDRAFPAGLSADVYRAEVEAEFGSAYMPDILQRYPPTQSPKYALSQLAGDVEAACEAQRVAQLIARAGSPVVLYSLDRAPEAGRPPDGRPAADLFAPYWARFASAARPEIERQRSNAVPRSACDFWDRFFLRSVAGSVPASQP